jgi:hypothetical protein
MLRRGIIYFYQRGPKSIKTSMQRLLTNRVLQVIFISILAAINVLPILPTMVDQGRDSGVYTYTAEVLYEGGLPYRDAWDNKGPGIYYIDAAGFALFGVNRWALWLMEMFFIMATAAIFYLLAVGLFPRTRTVFVGTFLFILMARHGSLIGNGNLTESFALLPQVTFLWLGFRFIRAPSILTGLMLGLVSSAAFIIRQNAVGMAISFVPILWLLGVLQIRSARSWLLVGSMVVGGLFGLGLVTFHLRDALPEAYSAIVVSPLKLHNWVNQERVYPWTAVIQSLFWPTARYIFWPFIPFIGLALVWIKRHRHDIDSSNSILYVWIAATFFLDLYFGNMTGKAYSHYYLSFVPIIVLLITLGYDQLHHRPRWLVAAGWVYIGFLAIGTAHGQYNRIERVPDTWDDAVIVSPLSVYVEENTAPDDTVLVWGISSYVNFQSGRLSPTQYHYGYPLVVPDYADAEFVADLIADLERNQPSMIVDRAINDGNRIPPLGEEDRAAWFADHGRHDTQDLQAVFDFVAAHCTPIERIHRARIYRCNYT